MKTKYEELREDVLDEEKAIETGGDLLWMKHLTGLQKQT